MTIKLSRIWCRDKGDRTDAWDAVSRHVLRLIIQARIDELCHSRSDVDFCVNRLKELKKQLQSLNPQPGEIDGS